MKLAQELWTTGGSTIVGRSEEVADADLVLGVGAPQILADPVIWQKLRAKWRRARVVTCSTAGEISGTRVVNDSLAVTAIRFQNTPLRCAEVPLSDGLTSKEVGRTLAKQLCGPGLSHVDWPLRVAQPNHDDHDVARDLNCTSS